jgi:hypothetical protein
MRRVRLREIVVCAGAFALGAVLAFFAEGPALFSDGAFAERLVALGVSVLAYLVLGAVVGALAPGLWKAAALCLVAPLVPVAVLYGDEAASSAAMVLLVAGFLLGDTAAALLGALVGARMRTRGA